MALLKSPYQLSLWHDVYDNETGKFEERKKGIIGSDTMTQEWRAQNIQLTKNVNGSRTLTFTMYNQYIDNLTGEKVNNPYTDLNTGLQNENKLKLKYKGKWYDFIIKNISEDSSTQSYAYTATDLFINELSKNGFEVILDTQKLNNYGTITDLATKALAGTDWSVDIDNSDVCVQTKNEFLAVVSMSPDTYVYPLLDPVVNEHGALQGTTKGAKTTLYEYLQSKVRAYSKIKYQVDKDYNISFSKPSRIYALAFYSSCTTKPKVFQFIYLPGLSENGSIGGTYTVRVTDGAKTTTYSNESYSAWSKMLIDDDGNIVNKDCQFLIELPEYQETSDSLQYFVPQGVTFSKLVPERKANRYVVSIQNQYLPKLGKYVEVCEKDSQPWYHYEEKEFIAPTFIKTCTGNSSFKNTGGWTGTMYDYDGLDEDDNGPYSASTNQEIGKVFVEAAVFPDPTQTFKNLNNMTSNEVVAKIEDKVVYSPRLKIYHTFPDDYYTPEKGSSKWRFTNVKPVLIEQGLYSKRTSLSDVFCRAGTPKGSTTRGTLVIAWRLTKINTDDKGKQTEVFLDKKEQILQCFNRITIEDTRYSTEHALYTNFNEVNNSPLKDICADYDISDPNQNVYYKEVPTTEKDENGLYFRKTYSYIIVPLHHNYTPAEFEAAALKTVIHLTPFTDEDDKTYNDKTYISIDGKREIYKSDYKALSEEEKLKYRKKTSEPFYFEDFQVFEYYADSYGRPIFPSEAQTSGITREDHWYFKDDITMEDLKKKGYTTSTNAYGNIISTPIYKTTVAKEVDFPPKLDFSSSKKRVVDVKESNCFNIIQTLAEQFEQWADFSITRDSEGRIETNGKKIKFKKYVGQDNHAGIQYGINLKQIQRTNVSDSLVTKMIVKANTNENAKSGFCSITRADGNPTKESYLFDFSYYFKQRLMGPSFTQSVFDEDMYLVKSGSSYQTLSGKTPHGLDISASSTSWNHFGLYSRLKMLNSKIEDYNKSLVEKQKELLEAESTYSLATKAVSSAVGEFESAYNRFVDLAGPNPFAQILSETTNTELPSIEYSTWGELLEASYDLKHYYSAMVMAKSIQQQQQMLADANAEKIEELNNDIAWFNTENTKLKSYKTKLLEAFYSKYSRFIQEGTWIDEKYVDDELYFLDAQQTLYNSCWPRVEYTINAVTLDMIPGYEFYNFEIGDKTWVQDPEFFGYNSDGTPYKKEIIVTETVNNLDSPDKDSFKVQTFKNQFQDLFKKITATVQSVQYQEGSYNRAASLAGADVDKKTAFLKDALNGPATTISNAKNQEVVFGEEGITVGNKFNANEALRLTSAAVMFHRLNENGELEWKTGITPDGISADYITAGQIDTAVIQIMNGSEAAFRWDVHGLTAFDSAGNGALGTINNTKGVRFNKYGIYGVDLKGTGKNLLTWKPNDLSEVVKQSTFALTWDGLKVEESNGGKVLIGKQIYTKDGKEEKALILVKDKNNQATFSVDESGMVFAKKGEIGNWKITDGGLLYDDDATDLNLIKCRLKDFTTTETDYYKGSLSHKGTYYSDTGEPLGRYRVDSGNATLTIDIIGRVKEVNNIKLEEAKAEDIKITIRPYPNSEAEVDFIFGGYTHIEANLETNTEETTRLLFKNQTTIQATFHTEDYIKVEYSIFLNIGLDKPTYFYLNPTQGTVFSNIDFVINYTPENFKRINSDGIQFYKQENGLIHQTLISHVGLFNMGHSINAGATTDELQIKEGHLMVVKGSQYSLLTSDCLYIYDQPSSDTNSKRFGIQVESNAIQFVERNTNGTVTDSQASIVYNPNKGLVISKRENGVDKSFVFNSDTIAKLNKLTAD